MESVKHVLIAGGTSGIGLAIAQALCFERYRVSVLGREPSAIEALRPKYPGLRFFKADLADPSSLAMACDRVDTEAGEVAALIVAGAHLHPIEPISRLRWEELNRTLDIDLKAPFFLARRFLPKMLSDGSGVVINLSSRAAAKPARGWSAYSVSKAGLEMLSASLHLETQGSGVSVYSVNPGATRTRMRADAFPAENPETLPHPLGTVGLYVHLLRDRPIWDGKTIDLYDWLAAHPEWRDYGARLVTEFGAKE